MPLAPWALALLIGYGCGSRSDDQEAARAAQAIGRPGRVVGVVRLAAGVSLPEYPEDEGGFDNPKWPSTCGTVRPADRAPVLMGKGRGLRGVLVAASEFSSNVTRESATHALAIERCRLAPRLLVAVEGDQIELSNRTPGTFFPALGSAPFMQSLFEGQSRTFPLEKAGMFQIRCRFAASCGRTDVIVMHHPVHTVTSAHGEFMLAHVPPQKDIRIHAWHPLFKEASARATIESGGTHRIEFVLEPR